MTPAADNDASKTNGDIRGAGGGRRGALTGGDLSSPQLYVTIKSLRISVNEGLNVLIML